MEVVRLAQGLWRWTTAAGPDGAGCPPGLVAASVYLETPEAVVLFDPAAPPGDTPDGERFWRALDADVARLGRPVAILLTTARHRRGTAHVVDRYAAGPGVTVWAPAAAGAALDEELGGVARAIAAGAVLPGGVRADVLVAFGGEVTFELPGRAGVVVGDALVGSTGGTLRLAGSSHARDALAADLAPLVARRPERVLPAHGAAVVADAGRALAGALGVVPG